MVGMIVRLLSVTSYLAMMSLMPWSVIWLMTVGTYSRIGDNHVNIFDVAYFCETSFAKLAGVG